MKIPIKMCNSSVSSNGINADTLKYDVNSTIKQAIDNSGGGSSSSPLAVRDPDSIVNSITTINFASGAAVSGGGSPGIVDVDCYLDRIKQTGTLVMSNISELDFTGTGVTLSQIDSHVCQVTVTAGTGGASVASSVATDTSNFNNNLSSADDTVQKALDTIDNFTLGGGTSQMVVTDGVTSVTSVVKIFASGAGVTVVNNGSGEAQLTIPGGGSGVIVEDTSTSSAVSTKIKFVSGATVFQNGGTAEVTVSGGSSSSVASSVTTNTTNFNNNLSSADDTVQKALDTLDNLTVSGGGTTIYTMVYDPANPSTIVVPSGWSYVADANNNMTITHNVGNKVLGTATAQAISHPPSGDYTSQIIHADTSNVIKTVYTENSGVLSSDKIWIGTANNFGGSGKWIINVTFVDTPSALI